MAEISKVIKYTLGVGIVIVALITTIILMIAILFSGVKDINADTVYRCDYKAFLQFKTNIDVYKNDTLTYNIQGDLFSVRSDPLTLCDVDNNKLIYAGDSFHYHTQDSHTIQSIQTQQVLCEMEGKYSFSGENYNLYINDTYIGKATFNSHGTHGEIKTDSGVLIADYSSSTFGNDYTVQIKKNDFFSDETLLMIFASYVSDYRYDKSHDKKN